MITQNDLFIDSIRKDATLSNSTIKYHVYCALKDIFEVRDFKSTLAKISYIDAIIDKVNYCLNITIYCARPGVLIGKAGYYFNFIKASLEYIFSMKVEITIIETLDEYF